MIELEEITPLIESRDLHALRDKLVALPAVEIAELFAELEDEQRVLIFRILPRECAADIFSELDVELQTGLLSGLGDRRIAKLLDEMAADDRTALFEEIPAEAARQLMMLLSREEREVALTLLGYPEGSVGRLMSPDYLSIQPSWKVYQVLDHIRTKGRSSDSFDTLYVIDTSGRLLDEISIRDILLAAPDTEIGELMNFTFESLNVTSDQSEAVEVFRRYDRPTFPVVDNNGLLLGIVTVDDILDVHEEEITEDIQKLGGTEALETPYSRTPLLTLIKKRANWLVILFLGEMLTASAMAVFEDEIERAVVLALFVPLIISSGGNAGSQAATLVIRALAVGEVRLGDWWRILRREFGAGLALGVILGAVGFLRVAVWSMFSPLYGPHWMMIGCTVAVSLVGVVMFGSIVGAMLPMILKGCRLDPATSSAPFVATLVDVTGLVIYFCVAMLLLTGKLL